MASGEKRVYWPGNVAKAFVIEQLLRRAAAGPLTVLDHGCGTGGEWDTVLRDHGELRLVGWDPDVRAAETARARLRGLDAEIHVGRLPTDVRADVVVSFSVLEHVLDRGTYLRQARAALAPGGVFFLNYDDGHFRTPFDPDEPSTLWPNARAAAHNLLAPLLARAGRADRYQRRIRAAEADALVAEAGFAVEGSWYHNVDSLRRLSKTVPPERAQDFARLWMDVEARLNAELGGVRVARPRRGDDAALWHVAESRTLLLVATGDPQGAPG
ncbi:MAG TPA: class I SAM-dependent methyltransferase [Acidimicrobiales bacterium]|nr:class I SAM-dependent methyltransferase [Acidimicrobiales bacterium]